MNMQVSIKILLVLLISICLFSCKKEPEAQFVLNDVELLPPNATKYKQKTNEQYIAILYSNLFQTSLSANDLFDLNNIIESIGDKELAREVIISNFMNDPSVQLPGAEEMNADIDNFIDDTYVRFLVRFPSEAEHTYLKNYIQGNPYMTPEMVYFSFALADEYMFY